MSTLSIAPAVALAFGLLFARAGGLLMALPQLLGVAIPVRIRLLLAMLLAGALMPLAQVALPRADGLGPIAILIVRELAIGVMLSFAAAVVVGGAVMAGDLCGAGMELNSGGLLRGSVQMPNVVADAFGTLAGVVFFLGGFHRALILGLARSLQVAPLGRLALPAPDLVIKLGGRIFVLALELGLPLLGPLFVLAITQGVIARLAPQVNILVAAPAAIVLAGLIFLALDAAGLTAGITRAWSSMTLQTLGWLDG